MSLVLAIVALSVALLFRQEAGRAALIIGLAFLAVAAVTALVSLSLAGELAAIGYYGLALALLLEVAAAVGIPMDVRSRMRKRQPSATVAAGRDRETAPRSEAPLTERIARYIHSR